MQNEYAGEKLSELLETYFCDAENTEEHEFLLKKLTYAYLKNFDIERRARIFNALADSNRLKILSMLRFREMCVCELTAALDVTQPNLTYHVKKLESVGLVEHEKRGRWVYYSLTDDEGSRKFKHMYVFNESTFGDSHG